jgi:hypothetical protein
MTTLTLMIRTSNSNQLKKIDDKLNSEFENLDVENQILGSSAGKWVQISISGEDEAIATSFVNKEIGTCPTTLENVKDLSAVKGYISKVDFEKQALRVDFGVFEPKTIHATIPLAYLQAQLADGKKVDLKKISETFGIIEELPLNIKITNSNVSESGTVEAEFSVEQLEKIRSWQQSLLDRLIILRSSFSDIEAVLERAMLNRDVIDVESLGMFEHVLTCKLGTDAAGLIPRVGRYMRNARFIIFNPRRITGFLSEQAALAK